MADDVWAAFDEAVNMGAAELEAWLKTEESKAVGWKDEGAGESVGHASGRKIVAILRKPKAKRTKADAEHAAKVVGYVKRHLAQRPTEVAGSRWEASLKNWGHKP